MLSFFLHRISVVCVHLSIDAAAHGSCWLGFASRRDWQEVFKVMKIKSLQPRLLYPAKLSFRMEGQIKYFPDKVKLKKFIITKPLLSEMLKGLT